MLTSVRVHVLYCVRHMRSLPLLLLLRRAQNPRFLTSQDGQNRNAVFSVASSCSHPVRILSSGQPISTDLLCNQHFRQQICSRLQNVLVPSGLVFLSNIAFRSFPVAPETRKKNASRKMSRRARPLQRLTEEQASPATQPNEMEQTADTAAQSSRRSARQPMRV